MEWVRVRAEESEKPRDQMHWKATGSVSRNATTPDHRCTGLAQAGEPLTPGSRPHMADALITCTTRKISAAVVSQVFIDNSVRKPKVTIAAPLPGCTREYAASTAATTMPRAVTAASPQRGSCRTAAACVDATGPSQSGLGRNPVNAGCPLGRSGARLDRRGRGRSGRRPLVGPASTVRLPAGRRQDHFYPAAPTGSLRPPSGYGFGHLLAAGGPGQSGMPTILARGGRAAGVVFGRSDAGSSGSHASDSSHGIISRRRLNAVAAQRV